jgi:predicted flap endonuclease-1-like 5' DNA nuclease
MPDGTVPNSSNAVAAAIAVARASLEQHLVQHPDWAAYQALERDPDSSVHARQELEQRLDELPGFHAYRQLRTAVTLLPMASADFPLVHARNAAAPNAPEQRAIRAQRSIAEPMPIATPDDLTRIRGIDTVLAKRLASIGIQRFSQIAAWQHGDVRTVAQALGLGRNFVRFGVIEQANWLEAERVARDVAQQSPRVTPAVPMNLSAIAIWAPNATLSQPAEPVHAPEPTATGSTMTQSARSRADAVARVRAGCPMNQIVSLARLAPELDQAIFIAIEIDDVLEAPSWRPMPLVPLVVSKISLVESKTSDLTTHSVGSLATDQPAAGPVEIRATAPAPQATLAEAVITAQGSAWQTQVAASTVAVSTRAPDHPGAAAEPPVHEWAGLRIDTLESELDLFTAEAAPGPASVSANLALQSHASSVEVPVAHAPDVPPKNAAALVEPADFAGLAGVSEAEVKIVQADQPRRPLLAPLPELPLSAGTAKTRARHSRVANEAPLPFSIVEEAAVVIVRRTTPTSPVSDLAFYAQTATEPPAPMRRFLKALTGA